MKRLIPLALAVALIGTACGDSDTADSTTTTSPSGPVTDRSPVFLGMVDFVYLESYPVQVRAVITGNMPTPCHELRWELDDTDPAAPVLEMWSEIDITVTCIQVLEPFEETIGIGSFETGSYMLEVNGGSYPFQV